jgi:carbon dioxide concentrating mechanism protein CcmN
MPLPHLEPVSYSEIYISGDVTIHESAVVAPGAILSAATDSRIVIGAGVCVGMGAIFNACHGAIEIAEGAVIGAGVLMVGRGKIGNNACVGSATTIFNASVDQMTVIPAGSLIGDNSRQVAIAVETQANNSKAHVNDNNSSNSPKEHASESFFQESPDVSATEINAPEEPSVVVESHQTEPESSHPSKSPVVGQVYINQLLVTLFPERDFLKRTQQNSE